ncbi:MAG: pyruvate kinase [Paracoccaceae bacterium]|nr:MAG: pyruvate kinase [Paracoccaceae bacterium]
MRRRRNVKIVATLGPASDSREMIRALFLAGADVFRLNMSHGSHDELRERHRLIREIELETGRPIGIIADLQGPKLRLGSFAGGRAVLKAGQRFRFDMQDAPGDATRVRLPHPEIFAALREGATLLIDDGKLRFRVLSVGEQVAEAEVVVGGEVSDRKGVNLPDVILPLRALSEKDRNDLEFACRLGVDWIALSFVQRPEDVAEARELVDGRARIIAKIEKPAAVQKFEAILAEADAIMVARGDLGVELPVQSVPTIQKRLIRHCRAVGKPVIVATQMLESMIAAPVPTRAEVSDVATAIYEGADAVMLSGESAAGKYPVEAVTTMNAVAEAVEEDGTWRELIEASRSPAQHGVRDAIVVAARAIAETTDVRAIACFTHSGSTAQLVSREKPQVPILALTPKRSTARRLTLVWGVHCVVVEEVERFKHAVISAVRVALREEFATEADRIIVIAGIPFNVSGSTNILRIAPMQERLIFEGEPG